MKEIFFIAVWSVFLPMRAQSDISTLLSGNSARRYDLNIEIGPRGERQQRLPVVILSGAKPGPTFTIVAGIHGYEYDPVIAVQQLIAEVDPVKLSGQLLILPLANPSSFFGRSLFVNPDDGKNLNRVFPGDKNGTVTERIAGFITSEIIARSDVFLDIHAGDANEDLIPFICYYRNPELSQQTSKAAQLCEASGFENIVSYSYSLEDGQPALFAFKQAVQDARVALSIESGGSGNVSGDSVSDIKSAILRMPGAMKMYDYVPPRGEVRKKTYFANQVYIKSEADGLFYSELRAGDTVARGQKLGQITDVFGNVISEIYSAESGVILYKIGTPPVKVGDGLFCVGV